MNTLSEAFAPFSEPPHWPSGVVLDMGPAGSHRGMIEGWSLPTPGKQKHREGMRFVVRCRTGDKPIQPGERVIYRDGRSVGVHR